MIITPEMYSPEMLSLLGVQSWEDVKSSRCEKLVPNLANKQKYICHYRNLKQYIKYGILLKKVHKVISFRQSTWLKPFIDFNTEQRKLADNDFKKDLFKILNAH